MRYLLASLALLWATSASATSVAPRLLEQIVADADYVVVANIERVDMIDRRGRAVTDPEARTGPGGTNEIRFHLKVKEALFARSGAVPPTLVVPLWKMWHFTLGDMQEQASKEDSIFLLKGDRFEPAYPADFQRPMEEKARIKKLLAPRR
ncbi:hypothetical protein [Pseudomonas sp. CGJS7]|uniref:hypothetical protein n=1 Tax=Pseudomonas sp. CGJS7 TaxID=3109348 RepID=UPI003009BE82